MIGLSSELWFAGWKYTIILTTLEFDELIIPKF